MIAYEKFGQHQPLNRQSERFAREGVPLSVSTLADLVGAACVALAPAFKHMQAMILAAEHVHSDDTTVPMLARGQAWLADVFDRIANHPARRLDELMLWNWTARPAETVPYAA